LGEQVESIAHVVVEQGVVGKGGHRPAGKDHRVPQCIVVTRDARFVESRAQAFREFDGIQSLGGQPPGRAELEGAGKQESEGRQEDGVAKHNGGPGDRSGWHGRRRNV
jgi:hypothetical protein